MRIGTGIVWQMNERAYSELRLPPSVLPRARSDVPVRALASVRQALPVHRLDGSNRTLQSRDAIK